MVRSNKQSVYDAAMSLPMSDRIELAESLLASVGGEELSRIEAAWLRVSEDRLAAYKRGEIQAEPAEDLIELLDEEAAP